MVRATHRCRSGRAPSRPPPLRRGALGSLRALGCSALPWASPSSFASRWRRRGQAPARPGHAPSPFASLRRRAFLPRPPPGNQVPPRPTSPPHEHLATVRLTARRRRTRRSTHVRRSVEKSSSTVRSRSHRARAARAATTPRTASPATTARPSAWPQGSRPEHFARRNTPSVLYLRFVPRFHFHWEEDVAAARRRGGFFWDGRIRLARRRWRSSR